MSLTLEGALTGDAAALAATGFSSPADGVDGPLGALTGKAWPAGIDSVVRQGGKRSRGEAGVRTRRRRGEEGSVQCNRLYSMLRPTHATASHHPRSRYCYSPPTTAGAVILSSLTPVVVVADGPGRLDFSSSSRLVGCDTGTALVSSSCHSEAATTGSSFDTTSR